MKGEQKLRAAIVAPCHIPLSEAWVSSLKAEAEANDATVIIVDDSDGHLGELPNTFEVFGYEAQKLFLGDLYDEFARMFHKSSACRVFGHLLAVTRGYDVVIGLDSDCIVKEGFVQQHLQFMGKDFGSGWFNPIGYPNFTRGYPYSQRKWPVVANMGLWENVLDINGKDRQDNEPKEVRLMGSTVPSGPFPFSGMNFALAKNAVSGFLFLPNFKHGEDDFRRIDDVWGGYIFEKMMHARHESPMVGYPIVFHDTVVVPEEDAAEEAAMYKWEDEFIKLVDECFNCANGEDAESYKFLWRMLQDEWQGHAGGPFVELQPAIEWWVKATERFC